MILVYKKKKKLIKKKIKSKLTIKEILELLYHFKKYPKNLVFWVGFGLGYPKSLIDFFFNFKGMLRIIRKLEFK